MVEKKQNNNKSFKEVFAKILGPKRCIFRELKMSLLIPKDPAETVKETLKLKTTPVDEWNLREQLALATAVRDSGSQVIGTCFN